jgi:hypothetical protein
VRIDSFEHCVSDSDEDSDSSDSSSSHQSLLPVRHALLLAGTGALNVVVGTGGGGGVVDFAAIAKRQEERKKKKDVKEIFLVLGLRF